MDAADASEAATCVLVLCTLPVATDASSLARALVSERLAACVNVLPPMGSIYRWQGNVEEATERQLLIKTTAARVSTLTARLTELHPYEVPEILVIDVAGGSERYLRWVVESA